MVASPQPSRVPPTLNIQHASGPIVAAKDIDELQALVPFDIVLPANEDLPLDLRLSRVSVLIPPEILGERAMERNTRVFLNFRKPDRSASVQIYESLVGPKMDADGIRTLRHNGTAVKIAGNAERSHIGAGWDGCDIGFFLLGGPGEAMTDENLLRIVESTLKACE